MAGERQGEQSSSRPPFDNTISVIAWALLTAALLAALTRCGLRTVAAAFGGAVLGAGVALLISNGDRTSVEWTGRKPRDRQYVIAALATCVAVPGVVFIVMAAGAD